MSEIQQYQPRAEVALTTAQDVAVHRLGEWAQSAQAAHSIAQTLVQTSFCPDGFRNKPGEATAAILAGIEVGLQPMAALRAFDVIQGQAAPRAITLRAVVQSHGHEMELVESTASRCKMRGRRKGSSDWQTVTWTIERAQTLGVTGKSNWKNQPQAMLVARATSELARLIASDAILGIGYSSEEVADGGTYESQIAAETTEPSAPTGTRRMSRKPVEAVSAPEPEPDSDDAPLPVTSAQVKKIAAAMGEAGITVRADALRYVNDVLPDGREVASRNELTKDEASRVIEALESDLAQPFAEPVDAELVES